jgi:hypothetical protein
MLPSKRKTILTVVLLAAFVPGTGLLTGPARCRCAAGEKPPAGLDLAEFQELKSILHIKKQPWATIPWKYSIAEARKLAAANKKPIFMVVNTGNALGCT